MAVRNDAGLAAAELSLHVEAATLATGVLAARLPPAPETVRGASLLAAQMVECSRPLMQGCRETIIIDAQLEL